MHWLSWQTFLVYTNASRGTRSATAPAFMSVLRSTGSRMCQLQRSEKGYYYINKSLLIWLNLRLKIFNLYQHPALRKCLHGQWYFEKEIIRSTHLPVNGEVSLSSGGTALYGRYPSLYGDLASQIVENVERYCFFCAIGDFPAADELWTTDLSL